MMQENETFEKAKTQVQCLSKLVDTSFQLWSHLQEEPEGFEKDHQIKMWGKEMKSKKNSLTNFPISAYMEVMIKISNLMEGQCKKMRDLLDAILVFKNKITLPKNTTHFYYIALAMVQPKPDMSWDM